MGTHFVYSNVLNKPRGIRSRRSVKLQLLAVILHLFLSKSVYEVYMRIKNENFHPSSKYANMMKKHWICWIFSKIMIFAIFENFENFHINKFQKVFSEFFGIFQIFRDFRKMKDENFIFWFSYGPHKPISIKPGPKWRKFVKSLRSAYGVLRSVRRGLQIYFRVCPWAG